MFYLLYMSASTERTTNGGEFPLTVVKKRAMFHHHRHVARIAFLMVALYIIIWLPWLVIVWISTGSDARRTSQELRITTMVIGYMPSALDPLLYTFMSPVLKKAMSKLYNKYKCH